MKKIFLSFLLILIWTNISYASNDIESALNKIPQEFSKECYEYYKKVDKNFFEANKEYKIVTNKKDLVITENSYILPYKYYSEGKERLDYSFINNYSYLNESNENYNFINDNNIKTYIELSISNWDYIELESQSDIKDFDFIFDYESNRLKPVYYIYLEDWYKEVKKENIEDFSFKKLKIVFESIREWNLVEKIKIYELSFKNKLTTIIFKSFFWNKEIEFFSSYNCNTLINTSFKKFDAFNIDKDTETKEVLLEKNPKYDVYIEKDYDKDGISDEFDNCPYQYNPLQTDSNSNWAWDLCSDDDRDGIYWYKDNCVNMYNPDQKDVNVNKVWDICEFDKDLDWIFDEIDNCVSTPNPDQKDDDNDDIWNACDNCNLYNPTQIDKDWNYIWDICDEKKLELEKNDKDKDWILDWKDNCKDISNHDQKDSDSDWVWDLCDNCKDIQNKDQLDENKNNVWDFCEDSDNDNFLWYLDNCINIANPDQKDDDNNGVWNLCEDYDNDKLLFVDDNCPYNYNPDQKDIDNDWIWDKCDEKDDRFIESNKWIFIWLLLLISMIFAWLIFIMTKKLNKK